MNRLMLSLSLCAIVSVVSFAASTEMTYEQYETALAEAQQREKAAKEEIAQEQAKIEALKQQIAETDQRIAAVIQETYRILGITEQDIVDAENEIASIRQGLLGLLAVMPQELLQRTSEIKGLQGRIDALKRKPVTYLRRLASQMSELDGLMQQVLARVPSSTGSQASQYTVRLVPERRDCLYRIAEHSDVYSDPLQWTRIYEANKDLINRSYNRYQQRHPESKYSKAADLIFPGQVLDIPR